MLKDAGAEIFDFTCLEMRLGWIGVRDTSLDAGAIVKKSIRMTTATGDDLGQHRKMIFCENNDFGNHG